MRYLLATAATFLATAASAEGNALLARYGAWDVTIGTDADGAMNCLAGTVNPQGDQIVFVAFQHENSIALTFYRANPQTSNFGPVEMPFYVDVDYTRWSFTGMGNHTGFGSPLSGDDFLLDVGNSYLLRVADGDGVTQAIFEIADGARDAVSHLYGCWATIKSGEVQ